MWFIKKKRSIYYVYLYYSDINIDIYNSVTIKLIFIAPRQTFKMLQTAGLVIILPQMNYFVSNLSLNSFNLSIEAFY